MLLDAPGEVLFARKGEGTPELLDRRRRDYAAMGEFANSRVVRIDVSTSLEQSLAQITRELRRSRPPS